MAIKVIWSGRADIVSKLSVKKYQCDTESDVGNLPTQSSGSDACDTGSIAMVLNPDEGKSYSRWLSAEGSWVEAPQRVLDVPTVIDGGTPATAH